MEKVEFGTARERFINGDPVEMSPNVRRLAELVLEQRERDRLNPEDPRKWAERLMNSMYGSD